MSAGHLTFIHNQMLLIVVGIFMAIAAVIVGLELYTSQAVNDNRSAVILHLERISEFAQTYYKKEASLGGGGQSFKEFKIPDKLLKDENGTYRIVYIKDQKILLEGVGTKKVEAILGFTDNGPLVTQQMLVRPSEIITNKVY